MDQIIKTVSGSERTFTFGGSLFANKNVQDFPFDLFYEVNHHKCASIIETSAIYSQESVNFLLNKGAELVKYELLQGDRYLSFVKSKNNDEEFSLILYYKTSFYCFQLDTENKMFSIKVIFLPELNPEPLAIFEEFVQNPVQKSKISVLITDCGEIIARSIDIETPIDMNLELNYGGGFIPIHDRIVDKLTNYKNGGLYMFHGDTGTGKSTYVRYLTSVIDREFIFIPSSAVEMLTSPSLLTTLLRHKNSILVIEDAEKAIESRENSENASLVSALLNMSDGLLGSLLQISLIVTYNCDKNLIDPALLRKGRLIQDHGFRNLNINDSQLLINSLGLDYKAEENMSLAEIYNISEETGYVEPEEKRMGFNA
jgi:energy-coupling factor transporter ATP-binding protein EcfA2